MKRNDFRKSLHKIKKEIDAKPTGNHYPVADKNSAIQENFCTCKDTQGNPKILYLTFKEAQAVCIYQQVDLHIYPCPFEKGWHLTKG